MVRRQGQDRDGRPPLPAPGWGQSLSIAIRIAGFNRLGAGSIFGEPPMKIVLTIDLGRIALAAVMLLHMIQ